MQTAARQELPEDAGCNCRSVRQAARQITQLYERHIAPTGLRATQFGVVAALARLGPVSINELATYMVMDRTTMGRALRPLERDGLVAIAPGRDGRTRALALTDAGRALFAEAAPKWQDAQREFEAAYGSGQASELRAALARAVAAAV